MRTKHKPPTSELSKKIRANRQERESRNKQAQRIGIPEPTLRAAEAKGRLPIGAAGMVLRRALGLETVG